MIDSAQAGSTGNSPRPPRGDFRLSMLATDQRYRGMMLQVLVFVLVMAAAWWLIRNAVTNLAELGKPFDMSFLFRRAGYDIPQQLIPYNSDDTHLRATIVGLLNTLLVSILGCILATILGVLIGVLRLSRNWLIARLMTIYVEIFRNIPLLLWIYIIFAVMIEIAPAPAAYRGDDPAATMWLYDLVAPTNRYLAVPRIVLDNDPGALGFGRIAYNWALIAFVAVFVAAMIARHFLRRWAQARLDATGVYPTIWWINLAMWLVPFIIMAWYFQIRLVPPELKGFNFQGGANLDNSFVALWLALSLYTAAFIAEIVRSGILAVPRGQVEAAAALGVSPRRIMSRVVLPQALRVIVPPLISQYLNLTKNSSLAIAVGYMDLRGTLGGTTLNQTGRELESMALMMGTYLVLSLMISGAMNLFNARVRLKER